MNQILHLGLGRFHRGHQAVYYQKAGGWKVISSTMRSNDERDKLRKVHLRYPVLELSHESETLTWINCISEALSLNEDLNKLIEVATSSHTKIITLTITEKGYCLNSSGEIDFSNRGILHDLTSEAPETAIGFLSLILSKRTTPITIISCDNLRGNGSKLKRAILGFMEKKGISIEWTLNHVAFPNTMVDRIVPALLPEKIKQLEESHGLKHSEIIATEKFSQWVIEDKFVSGRPDWDKVGVQFVSDVTPYEEMKLRLLNASHSYLAYAGLNRGYQFVHEAIADRELFSTIMTMLKEEVVPLLKIPSGFAVDAYIDQLMSRFRNNKLPHQLQQIAMDGSQKMPQRIFSSLEEARKKGTSTKNLDRAVDEWFEFLWRNKEDKINDPKADLLIQNVVLGKDAWKKSLKGQLGI